MASSLQNYSTKKVTLVKRNPNFDRIEKNYLFSNKISKEDVIDLSIGDTSEPLSKGIVDAIIAEALAMGTKEGYKGYGPSAGTPALREKIAASYHGLVEPDEVFVSDGAKCDIGRLQLLFKPDTIAIQNPTYPVYRDTAILTGCKQVLELLCTPENNFFPQTLPKADLFFLCSPNNPTGTTLTKEQLTFVVEHAKHHDARIIFDAAYACYIQDPKLPRSIYEIKGADEVAIEVNSFSKMAGFTGARLGWSVVPKKMQEHADYKRITSTFFNGPSLFSQAAGLVANPEHISHYMDNAKRLREAIAPFAKQVYGGIDAPFLWVDFGKPMWDFLLNEANILTIPGEGFGSCGKGFLRLSAFGSTEKINKACKRCSTLLSQLST